MKANKEMRRLSPKKYGLNFANRSLEMHRCGQDNVEEEIREK